MQIPSVEEAMQALQEQDICKKGEPAMDVALILLYASYVGENETELAKRTGLTAQRVFEIVTNLEKAGAWRGVDHSELLENSIAFGCDICCGLGQLKRGKPKGGEPTWMMTEAGIEYVEKDLLPSLNAKEKSNEHK